MIDLKQMREKIARWEADRLLDAAENSGMPEYHEVWMNALQNNKILFSNGKYDGVRYNSLREIDFRGPEFVNQEWRAQLNRFFWLPHLAWEYDRTHDERWAMMARDSIENWLDFRHYSGTETVAEVWKNCGDNCLSTSLRLGSRGLHGWFGTLPYFDGSRYFDETFIERMLSSAKDQVEFMLRNLTKHGNFRISQLDTLLFLSEVLPGFEQYRSRAVKGLSEAFRIQVENDGSHCEHTIGYHKWMTRVFTALAILARRRPELEFDIPYSKLMRMYDYELANYTPDGRVFGLNDVGRWHPSAKPEDVKQRRAYADRLRTFFDLPCGESHQSAFPDAGQFFFRDGNDAMVLDATRYGSGHAHIVRGGLLFYHGDRLQLGEPGSLNYERSDPFFFYGRASTMHNTVTVNNWYQVSASNAVVPICRDAPEYSFAVCRYTGGYMSCTHQFPEEALRTVQSCAGQHVRTMLWIKGHFAVVLDLIDAGLPEYDFAAHWQFLDAKTVLMENGMRTDSNGADLLICSPWCNYDVKAVEYNGDREKMIGFISPDGGGLSSGAPAPMLSLEGRAQGFIKPVQLLTVLVPYDDGAVPQVSADCEMIDEIFHCQVTVNGKTWHMAADLALLRDDFSGTSVERVGKIETDARAAVCSPEGKLTELNL